VVCLAPRAPGDSVDPRRLSGVGARPLNFTVRGPLVTPHQIVAVALRLFAVWLALQAFRTLPAFFTLKGTESPNYVWMSLMLAITAVVIFVLWAFPRTIAGKLLPPVDPQLRPPATPDTWLAIGCTLIGLWTLTETIPKLVYDFLLLNWTRMEGPLRLQDWGSLDTIYNVFKLAIAVWLVLGGKGVGKIFRWAQYAGVRKDL